MCLLVRLPWGALKATLDFRSSGFVGFRVGASSSRLSNPSWEPGSFGFPLRIEGISLPYNSPYHAFSMFHIVSYDVLNLLDHSWNQSVNGWHESVNLVLEQNCFGQSNLT